MDIKPPHWWTKKMRLAYERRRINKFFNNLEIYGGVVGGKAILFCYNANAPEMSYIVTEPL